MSAGPPLRAGGWLDRLRRIRDHLLSNTEFRERAASFPLTRMIARRRARDLFDLTAGFVYSQILLGCVQIRLFDLLLQAPRSASDIATRTNLPLDACERLLQAAQSLRLVEEREGGRFGLGPLGAALARNPGLTAMIEHHRHLYADLRDPVALLRGELEKTELAGYWPYADNPDAASLGGQDVRDYSALMALSQPMIAEEILDCFPLTNRKCLLDVGGGEGAFLAAAAARNPHLRLMLFDLPEVAARATNRFSELGILERASVHGGNFFSDQLPEGADVVSLVRILLDHGDDKALTLLRAVRRAINRDGMLLIAEPLPQHAGSSRAAGAYFGLYLFAMGRGRPRTRNEMAALLREAGFTRLKFLTGKRALQTGIAIARP